MSVETLDVAALGIAMVYLDRIGGVSEDQLAGLLLECEEALQHNGSATALELLPLVRSSNVAALRDMVNAPQPGEPTLMEQFETALAAGASCAELHEFRARARTANPKDPVIPAMNELLQSIGCYSPKVERTDR